MVVIVVLFTVPLSIRANRDNTIINGSGTDGAGIGDTSQLAEGTVSGRTILSAYPNPFISDVSVTYTTSRHTTARLSVYNLLGREIKTLAKGYHQPGSYLATWDGTDRSGKIVPTGMYYIIILEGENKQVLKLMKTR
jgi:flagellar hook assembly protein FlgD